jgi:hypothetical protein
MSDVTKQPSFPNNQYRSEKREGYADRSYVKCSGEGGEARPPTYDKNAFLAPADNENTQLAPSEQSLSKECGWNGGDSSCDSAGE